MTPNPVKEKLSAGQAAVGLWLAIGDPLVAEHLAAQGWDWLVVDTEHNPIDLLAAATMFQAISRFPVAPMVRIPEISELGIKRVLDAGAFGFVAPNVKTREEAQVVADYGQYPPRGKRSLGSGRYAPAFATDAATYFARANDEILRVVQIEHADGVRNIDAILSVPGIDACYIGPNDLCASMGLSPSLEPPHAEYEEAVQAIFRAAKRHRVISGIHCGTPETARRRIAEGWQLVGCASELSHLLAATRASRAIIER